MKFLGMGSLEILAILIIALIVLGPDRMIKSARRIGESLRELKRTMWKAEQYLEEDSFSSLSNPISNVRETSSSSEIKDTPTSVDDSPSDETQKNTSD